MKNILFGFHESISGGLYKACERAAAKGLRTMQIFTRNPRGWAYNKLTKDEINKFKRNCIDNKIEVVVAHMPYLPNISGNREELYKKSMDVLKEEIYRCSQLNIPYLVTHLGSHLGAGYEEGFKRIVKAVDYALSKNKSDVMLVLENTAGTKNSMGTKIEDISRIIDKSKFSDRLGVCIDTAHSWGGGYKIDTVSGINNFIKEIDKKIGLDKLKVIHLNDTLVEFNAGVDRHWHIGEGKIGEDCFKQIINSKKLVKIPKILETPVKKSGDELKNQKKIEGLLKV